MSDVLARFMSHVDITDDCWNWTAAITTRGYGQFSLNDGQRRLVSVHRWAYEAFVGPIPPDLQIDHLCRNRACVNPSHLEAVTQRENIMRGEGISAKNAVKTHCIHGHEFTPENTYIRPATGTRKCRQCNYERDRRRFLTRRAVRQRGMA